MQIKDIPNDYELITDSQEVQAIHNVCGINLQGCDSLFVQQTDYGYGNIYGFSMRS